MQRRDFFLSSLAVSIPDVAISKPSISCTIEAATPAFHLAATKVFEAYRDMVMTLPLPVISMDEYIQTLHKTFIHETHCRGLLPTIRRKGGRISDKTVDVRTIYMIELIRDPVFSYSQREVVAVVHLNGTSASWPLTL